MAPAQQTAKLAGTVEANETYIDRKRKGTRGRAAEGKTPVVTLIERGGEARSRVMRKATSRSLSIASTEHITTFRHATCIGISQSSTIGTIRARSRTANERTVAAIRKTAGKRLKYVRIVALASYEVLQQSSQRLRHRCLQVRRGWQSMLTMVGFACLSCRDWWPKLSDVLTCKIWV